MFRTCSKFCLAARYSRRQRVDAGVEFLVRVVCRASWGRDAAAAHAAIGSRRRERQADEGGGQNNCAAGYA